jgi:hypothetical protein
MYQMCVDTTATTSQGATKNKPGFSSFLVDHQWRQYGKQTMKKQREKIPWLLQRENK